MTIHRDNIIRFYEIIKNLLLEVEAVYTHLTELPIGGEGNPSQFTVINIMDSISHPELTGLVCIGGVVLKHSDFDKLTNFLQTYLLKLELINIRFDKMDISDKEIKDAYETVGTIVEIFKRKVTSDGK